MDEKRIISEFTKLLTHLSENTEKTSEGIQSLLALSGNQLKALKDLASSTANFTAEVTDAIFDSQEAEEEFNQKILDKEEELSELSDDEVEKMANAMQDGLDGVKDAVEEIVEQNETKAKKDKKNKQKTDKRESERVDHFENASQNLSKTAQFLSKESGINKIFTFIPDLMDSFRSEFSGLFSAFDTFLLSPLKGIGSGIMGIFSLGGGLSESEQKESERAEDREDSEKINENLEEIAKNTRKEKGMIKGKDFDLSKLFGAGGFFGLPMGKIKALAGSAGALLMKAVGIGMIIGGVYMAVQDFMDGFAKGGFGEGLYRAFVGKTDQGIMSTLKNAGKWALIGAGIGSFVPVVGTIAGGIIGASLGLTLNYLAQVFEQEDKTLGQKVSDLIFGGSGGWKSVVANGGKFALVGGTIGLALGSIPGAIVGAFIGASIGMSLSFLKQEFDKTDGSLVDRLVSFFIGGGGGWKASLAQGGKYAVIGSTIGIPFGLIGMIVGGAIGFAIGFIVNFVSQILDPEIKAGISNIFTKMIGWVGDAWTWLSEGTTSLFSNVFNFYKETWTSIVEKMIYASSLILLPFKYLWEGFEWLSEKLGIKPYIDAFKTKVSKMWTAVKDTFGQLIDWITNIGTNLWDSFKTVIGDYWKRIKQWVGASDEDESDPLPTGATPTKRVVKKEQQNEKKVENRAETILDSGIKTSDAVSSVADVTEATKEDIVKGNSTTKDISKILKDMTTFFKNDFLKKMESYFDKSSSYLADTLFNIQQEDRMWSYQTAHGSLAGYGSRVKEFSGEIAKLEKGGTKGYEMKLKDIRQNSIDNSTSIITNNSIIDGYSDSLRKKKQRN
ncbi:MAG TPA: hypothetical protein PK151_04490 [Caldisericia bacterium]|nr:hypothetical protein [Caldisericia bacterium]